MAETAPDGWTDAEQRLWEAFRQGERLDLRTGGDAEDGAVRGGDWGAERTVRAEVLARLLLHGPEAAEGRVASLRLVGAYVTGPLDLAGAALSHYVELQQCRFDGMLFLAEAAAGTIRFIGCLIPRLEASRLVTEGDLHLARCTVPGGVRLTDARIGSDLLLNLSELGSDRHGRALAADGASVHQDLEAERLTAHGGVSLRTARVGGRLSLRGADLRATGPARNCLDLARISVGSTLYLTGSLVGGRSGAREIQGHGYGAPSDPTAPATPFRARGGVRLVDGRFEGACLIANAEFTLTDRQELSLSRIQTPELRFTCPTPPDGPVSLSRARVGNLVDAPGSWPRHGRVRLTGFSYESLRPEVPFTVDQRIAWLEDSLGEYRPEPYEQLAAALRRDGRDDDARRVLHAKQQRRRATLPAPARAWGLLQDVTVGYGYRPGRAALWLLLAWLLGTGYFLQHPPTPLKPDERPTWDPALYALGKLLPVVDLGQNGWNPDRPGQWAAAALVLTGWILATTAVTGATRLLQRT
ncbi:oxidoreductase [Kitasatospora sp. NPDC051914]|uniref:oxidoreductase n=1 Tax=Kitasatospora sp. NPDC051914 TaxID=3154945 RepID=UPI0034211626